MKKLLSSFVFLHPVKYYYYYQQISLVAGLGIVALMLDWLSGHGGVLADNSLLEMATTGAEWLFAGYGVWLVIRFVWEESRSSRLPAQFLVLAGFSLFGMAIYWNWFELAISGYLLCFSGWASFKTYELTEAVLTKLRNCQASALAARVLLKETKQENSERSHLRNLEWRLANILSHLQLLIANIKAGKPLGGLQILVGENLDDEIKIMVNEVSLLRNAIQVLS